LENSEKINELLSRIIPICSFCKKVRDEDGNWIPVEEYLLRFGIEFSHSLCSPCKEENYPEFK